MSAYYYEPFFSWSDLNRIFDDFSGGRNSSERQVQKGNGSSPTGGSKLFQPRMDIHENTEGNLVTATFELPGINKQDVHIDVQNTRLVISGETTHSNEFKEDGYVHRERRYGKFSRSLPLPSGTQASDIKASMADGVLTVTFPKTSPEQLPQRVNIA